MLGDGQRDPACAVCGSLALVHAAAAVADVRSTPGADASQALASCVGDGLIPKPSVSLSLRCFGAALDRPNQCLQARRKLVDPGFTGSESLTKLLKFGRSPSRWPLLPRRPEASTKTSDALGKGSAMNARDVRILMTSWVEGPGVHPAQVDGIALAR